MTAKSLRQRADTMDQVIQRLIRKCALREQKAVVRAAIRVARPFMQTQFERGNRGCIAQLVRAVKRLEKASKR